MSIAFFFCIEPGLLEAQGILLARSLRRFGGQLSEAPLHAVRPRVGPALRDDTTAELGRLDVRLHDAPSGAAFEFPRLNKVRVAAWAESALPESTLVFLDTDTVFIASPDALQLDGTEVVAVRPVDSKNICSAGIEDPRDAYWQEVYRACGSPEPPSVLSTVDGLRLRGCWNSGLVAVKREAGLFGAWLTNVTTMMETGLLPPVRPKPGVGIGLVDQVALAATLAHVEGRIRTLPWAYNYCLNKRSWMPEPLRHADWDQLVHLHYHRWFNKPGFLEELRPPMRLDSRRYEWLAGQLPLEPTFDERLPRRRRVLRRKTRVWPAFFVVGTGRCGTNLVRELLNAHPDLFVVRESHWLPMLQQRFGSRVMPYREQLEVIHSVSMAKGITAFERQARFHRLAVGELERRLLELLEPAREGTPQMLMEGFYELMAGIHRVRLVGDKTPDYGFYMQQLSELWPGARFLHIARDGRDVALSMADNLTFRYLAASGETDWGRLALNREFERFRAQIEEELPLASFFDLWMRRLQRIRVEADDLATDRYLEIRYEDLLSRPTEELERIGQFLGLRSTGLRARSWIRRAPRQVRPNLGKNQNHPAYLELTRSRHETLADLGFDPEILQ